VINRWTIEFYNEISLNII